jgi:hypothetical protein
MDNAGADQKHTTHHLITATYLCIRQTALGHGVDTPGSFALRGYTATMGSVDHRHRIGGEDRGRRIGFYAPAKRVQTIECVAGQNC